jgi:UPF0755 protein
MRLLFVLAVLCVIAAGVFEWAYSAWDAPAPPAPYGNQTIVMVPPHSRAHDVAQMLEQKGVTKFGLLFEFSLRLRGMADKIKAGEYAIPSAATMAQVATILVEGKSIQHKLTAAEGLTSDMIWKLVQKNDVLTGDAGPVPQEGSLLPETYLFTRGETRAHLLAKMARAQDAFLAGKWESRASGLPLASMREAIILASIVEKETGLASERRHVAAIFINRLKIGMRLQTDPTIIYDLTKGYPLGRGIRASELAAATPYNTYVITGLPPGPICNPGKDAIAAVLNPETSDDLYFVATGHGGHAFAATIAQQERNVAAYRAFERRNQPTPVTVSERLDETPVPVPDVKAPKLPAPHKKKRAGHHR